MPRQRTRIECVCPQCGKHFFVKPCNFTGRNYCSHSCAASNRYGPATERFWEHVVKTDGCWLWSGSHIKINGYGVLHIRYKTVYAHRFSWEIHFGSVPEGLFVCHTCDNPGCCNPVHLWLGTSADNSADCVRKGRQSRGENRPLAKLTEQDVRAVRAARARGEPRKIIAARFHVSRAAIRFIDLGQTWKHVF